MTAHRIRVRGVVQGVGFRPFVWRLARELDLRGWVRNDADGVEIEAHGSDAALGVLVERLRRDAPPRARVDEVAAQALTPADAPRGFSVIDSGAGGGRTAIGPDTVVCADCLAEIFAPGEGRRQRYAFTTCTHCGPRYTIAAALPYDRPRTSLAPFPLCADCCAEYEDPADRRFHAEATCCRNCGPRLQLFAADGGEITDEDPIAGTVRRLRDGEIVAIKGLGGFHLVCDARNPDAVARLRQRKAREQKPFAVMVASVASLAGLAAPSVADEALLTSAERPVVLVRKHTGCDQALPGVAPGIAWLGVLLPTTPIHYLLFHEAAGRPAGTGWLAQPQALALVMTSANPGGEPLVIGNDEAGLRLAGIADAFLMHDREILARCDDSVVRAGSASFQFIRRARGYTPTAIRLPHSGPSVLAFGGAFKNTICVTRGDEAFVSTHIGSLDNAATCDFLDETVARMLDLTEVAPEIVAHDLHPDFLATRQALAFAEHNGLPAYAVQHHHAHIAAVCAEHRIDEAVLGLALDGVGLGSDGGAWGGELLRVDGAQSLRLGHLLPLQLPGGDRAAREPWRMAAAALAALGRGDEIPQRFAGQPAAATVMTMLERQLNCPPTSSLGRCFDAAAGLLGVCPVMAYEGQAAMRLEGLAEVHGPEPALAGGWRIDAGRLDLLPLFAALAGIDDAGRGAALFHATLAAALADWAIAAAGEQKLETVACAGGCFLNRLLAGDLRTRLAAAGLRVVEARQVPPNDGGLALGQAWAAIAASRLAGEV